MSKSTKYTSKKIAVASPADDLDASELKILKEAAKATKYSASKWAQHPIQARQLISDYEKLNGRRLAASVNFLELSIAIGGTYVTASPKFLNNTIALLKKVGFNPAGETKFDFGTEVIFPKETDSGLAYNINVNGKSVLDGVVELSYKALRRLREAAAALGKGVELVNDVDLGI
jgi:hypothetical protein